MRGSEPRKPKKQQKTPPPIPHSFLKKKKKLSADSGPREARNPFWALRRRAWHPWKRMASSSQSIQNELIQLVWANSESWSEEIQKTADREDRKGQERPVKRSEPRKPKKKKNTPTDSLQFPFKQSPRSADVGPRGARSPVWGLPERRLRWSGSLQKKASMMHGFTPSNFLSAWSSKRSGICIHV